MPSCRPAPVHAITPLIRTRLARLFPALLLASQLSACGGGGGEQSTGTAALSGSVGDGPIIGAQVEAIDATGRVVASTVSDGRAHYRLELPGDTRYPVRILATGGTDLVTNAAPDFDLLSIASDADARTANLNPFSTLIVAAAEQMPGGATPDNVRQMTAQVLDQLGYGLDPAMVPDPVTTPVTANNVAAIVRASEALGETVRRVRDRLRAAGVTLDGDRILDVLAGDITDGAIDGNGPGADQRIAATTTVVTAQVLVETLSNALQVDGYDASGRMDDAIATTFPDSGMRTADLTTSAGLLAQTRATIAGAHALQPTPELTALVHIVDTLEAGSSPDEVATVLPPATAADLEAVADLVASASDQELAQVNDATGAQTGSSTSNTTCSGCTDPADPTITLSWQPATGQVLGYRIYYGPSASDTGTLAATTSATSVKLRAGADLGAVTGDRVCFRIKSYNAAGSSPFSTAVCSTL